MSDIRQFLKSALHFLLPPSILMVRGEELPAVSNSTTQFTPAISLTFDDGPHPEFTSRLLDNLASVGIRGTFFVVGQQAAKFPELLKRIAAEGHEIGNHTWTHSEPRETSTAKFIDEIRRTREFIEDATGRECRLVRPPKGELTVGKMWSLIRHRQTIVLWNNDPRDYRMESYCEMEDWCRAYRPAHGDIVLMHDIHPHAATGVVMLGVQSATSGLRYVTVSEWLKRMAAPEVCPAC